MIANPLERPLREHESPEVQFRATGEKVRTIIDDLSGPEICELLREHVRSLQSISPPESCHVLDLDQLRKPGITFWSVWDQQELAGCGALKEVDPAHGEVKSMRTVPKFLRRGVGSLVLTAIIAEASRRGYTRLSLETGAGEPFFPAHQLYRKFGFQECGPFGDYANDPMSLFMSRALSQADKSQFPQQQGDPLKGLRRP